jgi:hypothetical protein
MEDVGWRSWPGRRRRSSVARGTDGSVGVLQYQRLLFIANNSRFLILPEAHHPNLASRVLSLNLRRLSADWQAVHGHEVLLAETFVDPQRFTGACYRAANWLVLGQSRGFAKRRQTYVRHGSPKWVLVYPLRRRARERLADPSWQPRRAVMNLKALTTMQMERLQDVLRTLPDGRKPRGIRHPYRAVLTISLAGVLCGAKSYVALGEFARSLMQSQLGRLRARINPRTRIFDPPSESCIRRVLQSSDAAAIDRALGQWLLDQSPADDAVALDGKTLRGARRPDGKQVHLLSAFLHHQGVTVAQKEVGEKTNEIPELPRLLEPLNIAGRVVTADAMHTQTETARFIVKDKKADYLLIAKDNQKTLREDIAALDENDFSPGARNSRKRPRSLGNAAHSSLDGAERLSQIPLLRPDLPPLSRTHHDQNRKG